MTTMPKHSSTEIAALRDVVAGGGGRTVVVIGEAEPYFVGVRAAPATNRFEAVLQIMGDTNYERIVAVTGGGTDGFLPDNFWVSDNFRVGRDAGGWMLRGSKPSGPGGAAAAAAPPPAQGKLADDHDYGAAAKRSLRGGADKLIGPFDASHTWDFTVSRLADWMTSLTGRAYHDGRMTEVKNGTPVPRTLIIIDERVVMPRADHIRSRTTPSPKMKTEMGAWLSHLPKLVQGTPVDVVLLAATNRTPEALRQNKYVVHFVIDFVRKNSHSEVTDEQLAHHQDVVAYPAVGWSDFATVRLKTVTQEKPICTFLPESPARSALYDLVRLQPAKPAPTPLDELDGMVGLAPIKEQVRSLISLMEVQQRQQQFGVVNQPINLNTVLYGNPGTGKTTIARILARAFGKLSILSGTKFTEVTAKDLLGEYVGQSRQKTVQACERALGGVLFIDEAYDLEPRQGNSYGEEAITELLKFLLERNRDLAVIVAGYKDRMERFLRANPGLFGRFAHFFDIPDLSDEELLIICRSKVQKMGLIINDGCDSAVLERFATYRARCVEIGQYFRNGGEVDKLIDGVRIAHAGRLQRMGMHSLGEEICRTLMPEDFRAAKLGDSN